MKNRMSTEVKDKVLPTGVYHLADGTTRPRRESSFLAKLFERVQQKRVHGQQLQILAEAIDRR